MACSISLVTMELTAPQGFGPAEKGACQMTTSITKKILMAGLCAATLGASMISFSDSAEARYYRRGNGGAVAAGVVGGLALGALAAGAASNAYAAPVAPGYAVPAYGHP